MPTPIFVLAGQSNAGRVAGEIRLALDARYGADGYQLVRAHSSGAPLTSTRETKSDWLTPGESRTQMLDATISALRAHADSHVAGVIWVQGEGDTDGSGTPARYRDLFLDLLDEFRDGVRAAIGARAGVDGAPVVIAGLSDHAPEARNRENWGAIQAELDRLGADHRGMVTVDPDRVAEAAGLRPGAMFSDGLHYSNPFSLAFADALVDAIDIAGREGAPTQTLGTQASASRMGSAADDELTGMAGADTLCGHAGNDTLVGRDGDDILIGDLLPVASQQDLSAQIFRLYQAALGRAPDSLGHQGWVTQIFEGRASLDDVAERFVTAREFVARYGDNLGESRFVDLLYRNVLDRNADAAGKRGWLDALSNGAERAEIVLRFSESREFRNMSAADAQAYALSNTPQVWSDDVFRLYQTTLDRSPDLGGFLGWTARLGSGTPFLSVVEGFVASREFTATYGPRLGNGAFIDLLYQNTLGRSADPLGRQTWLDAMAEGTTRAEVVRGFTQSRELTASTAQAVADWVRAQGENDVLSGGAGSNILSGGMMSDRFIFSPVMGGTHRVIDLEPWDVLEFRHFGYGTDAEARAHMLQSGRDVLFQDRGVTVILEDTTLATVSDDMILV